MSGRLVNRVLYDRGQPVAPSRASDNRLVTDQELYELHRKVTAVMVWRGLDIPAPPTKAALASDHALHDREDVAKLIPHFYRL